MRNQGNIVENMFTFRLASLAMSIAVPSFKSIVLGQYDAFRTQVQSFHEFHAIGN